MSRFSGALIALAAGALAGALVLGIGGRLLMAALVLLAGGHPSFSPGGSLEVVAVGTGYGAAGGLLSLLLRWGRAGRTIAAGTLLGLLLFGVAWLTSPVGRGAAAGLGARLPLALGLAALTFVIYGLVVCALLACWLPRREVPRGSVV